MGRMTTQIYILPLSQLGRFKVQLPEYNGDEAGLKTAEAESLNFTRAIVS